MLRRTVSLALLSLATTALLVGGAAASLPAVPGLPGLPGLSRRPAAVADAATADDQAFLSLINGVRASRGVAPLTVDANLTALAQDHSAWMAAGHGLVHTAGLSAGVTTRWARLGENIGYGSGVEVIWQAFLNSPEHFANLTDPRFDRVGIATVVAADGIEWTTHRFLQTAAAPPPAPAPTPAPPVVAPPTTPRRPAAPPATSTPRVTRPPATVAPVTPPPVTEPPVTAPPPLVATPPNPAGVAYVLDALHVAG